MRPRIHAVVLGSESSEFADEVRRLFAELGRAGGPTGLTGECAPAVDVYETDEAVEIVLDVPGLDPAAVRIVIKGDAVLVVGEKTARRAHRESTFHLVERGFGRFARTVRLGSSCDTGRARATLVDGELRIRVPKIADRRGTPFQVKIEPVRH